MIHRLSLFVWFLLFGILSLINAQQVHANNIPVTSVSLDQTSLTLALGGQSATLTVTVLPAEATNQNVIWTSSKPQVATVHNGTITPVSVGKTTIVVSSVDGGKIATCEVTVIRPVTGVSLNKKKLEMILGGDTQTLIATVSPSNATNKAVSWSSSNESVVTVINGTVTAHSAGTPTVTVTSDDGGFSDSCEVTVSVMPVSGLKINKTSLTLSVGGASEKLTATVQPANATNKNLNWTITNSNVATIDQNGNVTPKSQGTATIVVTTQDGGFTATCELTVIGHIAVTQVVLDRTSVILNSGGQTTTLIATVSPSNASNKTVRWTSSNTSVASVNSSGVVTSGIAGTATITATTVDGNKTATCTVTVNANKARDLIISKRSSSSVDLSWSGTTGTVRVELKRRGSSTIVDYIDTSDRTARFSGLSTSVEYNVYINGVYMDWFVLGDSSPNHVQIRKTGSSSVEISWSGTSGYVDVELRRYSSIADTIRTNSRSASFSGLYSDVEYSVYIDGIYVDHFRIDDMGDQVSNFRVIRKTSSSVDLAWSGTSGYVEVELRRGRTRVDFIRTRNQSASFSGLSPDTQYDIYINGSYVDFFTTDRSAESIRNFSIIKREPERAVELYWTGGNAASDVVLKKGTMVFDSKQSTSGYARFSGLDYYQEYSVYIDDRFMGTVKIQKPFSYPDIQGLWAQGAIERLTQYKIISGFTDGSFKPGNFISREQFIKMLVEAKRYSISNPTATAFTDLDPKRWSAPYIQAAIQSGIIVPKEYGARLEPAKAISREEMAIMLARAQKLKADTSALHFKDKAEIQNKGLVGAVVKSGIIKGYPDNTFKPKGYLDRASAANVINQIFQP